MQEVYNTIKKHNLPLWDKFPDLDLYMDQVLSLISKYFEGLPDSSDKELTASMINNYVKLKIIPPPSGKRYGKKHLAYLIMICMLKPVLPISAIKQIIDDAESNSGCEQVYYCFCSEYNAANKAAAEAAESRGAAGAYSSILSTALAARAEQSIALELLARETSAETK